MIDDPLGLIVQGIFVLAAGMYPVGFLFGVCSDCCDQCPPCSRCTHYADGCPEFDGALDWTYTVSDIGTVSVPDTPLEPCTGTGLGDNSLEISFDLLPEVPADVADEMGGGWFAAGFCSGDFEQPPQVDECGCTTCGYGISLRAIFKANDDTLVFGKYFYGTIKDCSQTVIEMTSESEWSTDTAGPWPWPGCDDCGENGASVPAFDAIPDLKEFLDSLTITMSLTTDPCECGACCEYDGNGGTICTDNVAEGSCEGPWLGVDTTCESDGPCPIGSCCDAATGDCTQTFEADCAGTWTLGQSCDPNPCPPPPQGACCDGEGNCTQTTEANCVGTWSEGVECDPNPCPQPPMGACCDFAGDCTQTTQANCVGDSIWTEGVSCDPNPCSPLGYCCLYLDGDYVGYFGPVPEAECTLVEGDIEAGYSVVWTEGEVIDCPPTNP